MIYLQSLESARVGSAVPRNIEMLRKSVGDTAARNAIIATTKWDLAGEDVARRRHDLLCTNDKFFPVLTKRGAQVLPCRKGYRREVLDATVRQHREDISTQIQKEITFLANIFPSANRVSQQQGHTRGVPSNWPIKIIRSWISRPTSPITAMNPLGQPQQLLSQIATNAREQNTPSVKMATTTKPTPLANDELPGLGDAKLAQKYTSEIGNSTDIPQKPRPPDKSSGRPTQSPLKNEPFNTQITLTPSGNLIRHPKDLAPYTKGRVDPVRQGNNTSGLQVCPSPTDLDEFSSPVQSSPQTLPINRVDSPPLKEDEKGPEPPSINNGSSRHDATPIVRDVPRHCLSGSTISGPSRSRSPNTKSGQTKPSHESTEMPCEEPLSDSLQDLIKSNPLVDLTGQVTLEYPAVAEGNFGSVYKGIWKDQPVCFL